MKTGTIEIEVWSDYVCPFCYLAEPTLAQLEQKFPAAVQITWRAFELRPDPVPTLDPKGEYLREVWARSVYPMAQQRGMLLRLPPVQPRSRLAHEAAAFGRSQGKFNAMHDALFRAFFERGEDIGQLEVLVAVGALVGLDRAELRAALEEGRHRQEVLDDETLARELGLSGVPASLVRRTAGSLAEAVLVEGAQPLAVFERAIERVGGSN